MSFENLAVEIAEEFSGLERREWLGDGFAFFRAGPGQNRHRPGYWQWYRANVILPNPARLAWEQEKHRRHQRAYAARLKARAQ